MKRLALTLLLVSGLAGAQAPETLAPEVITSEKQQREDEMEACLVEARYAVYVARERDKGTPIQQLKERVPGDDMLWARMTIGNIYRHPVPPDEVEEVYLMRCEG